MSLKIVKIIGREKTEEGIFRAEVIFPSENCYEVKVQDPFLEEGEIETDQEERLRWYFENYRFSPYTDWERASRAEKSIVFYGESLFNNLFVQNEALIEWRNLVTDLDKIRIQIYSKDPSFQALHWEALKDPKEPKALCLKGTEFTRTSGTNTPNLSVQPSCRLNLLMITARPNGKDDIEYRTITRPVVEAIEKNRMQVQIHLLRPPTLKNLKDHLRDKSGFYHIIHFDVHGNVLSFQDYKKITSGGGKKSSRKVIKPYKGTQAFIALLGTEGGLDLVLANDIAELLKDAHIPVCFLNACQSGMATSKKSNRENGGKNLTLDASLAMTLLERGVRLVLGMAWSLTVIGAQIMMKSLYDALTRGDEPSIALNLARQSMSDEACRFSRENRSINLEDWLLPVVWGKGDFSISLQLEKAGAEEKDAFLEQEYRRQKELEDVKTVGQYGFLGRDVDILNIETLLLQKNILLIKGMGGTGKTTLLGHMSEWWLKTGWIDHVFYFGYDRKSYHAEEILNTIAETVMPRIEYSFFLTIPKIETKSLHLADFLKQSNNTPEVLLILDNMESVTGTEKSVGSALKEKARVILVKTLKTLMRSTIKILLGSRSDEKWLGKDTFKDSIYILEGLDRISRFHLAEKILAGITIGNEDRDEFNRLMEILAGYPLAMEIILPNLTKRTAKEMREILTGAGVTLEGRTISEEIFKCINISYSLLTPEAKESMLVFTPFTSFLNGYFLEDYLKELQATGKFSHLTLDDLEDSLSQAEKQGLLTEIFSKTYSIQPVFPFFLGQQVEHFFDEDRKTGIEQAFCSYMTILAERYAKIINSKKAEENQMGILLFKEERENLHKALHRRLDQEGDFSRLFDVFGFYYQQQPLYYETIEFVEGVVKKLDKFSRKNPEFMSMYTSVVVNLGKSYQDIKDFSEAKKNLKKALSLNQKLGKREIAASVFHNLGVIAFEEHDLPEAKKNYLEALKIYQKLEYLYEQASVYHNLGIVAADEWNWEEAKKNYLEALKTYRELNEKQSLADTYHQLGNVAYKEQDWPEAKKNYMRALDIFQEFNNLKGQANCYHQLGVVAQAERKLFEAKKNYIKSLEIKQAYSDRYHQADTYIQLGIVALECGDLKEAKRYYLESLKIFREFNDEHSQGTALLQLGLLAYSEGDFQEAKKNYLETLKIFQMLNDSYRQAGAYSGLGMVAEDEKNFASSLKHSVSALEIFQQYNNDHFVRMTIERIYRIMQQWDAEEAIEKLHVEEKTKELLREINKQSTGDKK
ncbi:MAG: tetratricopeptide repeat protein [Candidatus Aminicenantes bacterium]|nr:tetratricopeptide repeat protein [Candidatus Aminicenantes bacterium]